MSLIALAEAIDRLVEAKQAYVTESESAATVSALSAAHASEIKVLCEPLGWSVKLFDRADEPWGNAETPDPDFAPFRVIIQKPVAPANTLQLISNYAFAQWLESGHAAPRWHIARFKGSLAVGVRVLESWECMQEVVVMAATKSPRALVREFGNVRRVPEDVRHWLSSALEAEHFAQPTTQIWVRAASAALLYCLPDEIGADDGTFKFRGPPRLTLPGFHTATETLDHATFNTLLGVSRWIFENEHEAEMRHVLLAVELARAGMASGSTPTFLCQHLAHAWESAQIVYQMVLTETGRDTLKALSDLRKAVTEETAKLSDIGRQLTSSVAAAVATGVGLIAARIAAKAPVEIIVIVMLVVALYIAMVISSGVQFMRLQRQLRMDWQHRLYRFLPDVEYVRMVTIPTAKAERSFVWTAWLGGIAVTVLTLTCIWVVPAPTSVVPEPPSTAVPRASQSTPSSNSSSVTGIFTSDKSSAKTAIPDSSQGGTNTSPTSQSGK